MTHKHAVQIYYEDTDLSGAVYHANYFKYFERAREHMFGPAELAQLWNDQGLGFVVYKCHATFKEAAQLADQLEIRTHVTAESEYRLIFQQDVYRVGGVTPLVEGEVQLVCVDQANKLVRIPANVLRGVGL